MTNEEFFRDSFIRCIVILVGILLATCFYYTGARPWFVVGSLSVASYHVGVMMRRLVVQDTREAMERVGRK